MLGISSTSAKKLIGHALELRHRLPRMWSHVQSGQVPAWRARSVAETTIHSTPALTREAAAFVDSQVAAVAGRIGPAQLDRLVAETIKRFDLAAPDPAADPEDGYLHVDPRHATLHDDDVHFAGTMRFEAELDIADALDLDRSLAQHAAEQKALGSTESLDVRRSKALGDLARTQTAFDLFTACWRGRQPTPRTEDGDGDGLPAAREVVLHAHFDADFVGEQTVFGPTGRLEERQRLLLLDQIQSWCGDSRTKITIKPVIDLNAELSTPAYEVPEPIREQVILRDGTCVFPWCSRPARGCDIDHVVPYDHDAQAEGPRAARSDNDEQPRRPVPVPPPPQDPQRLALPRHRPACFEWTSPHGHRFRRDPTGTTALHDSGSTSPPGIPRSRRR